jgi:pimeloyl-ACP methyl ester carboxylesterase
MLPRRLLVATLMLTVAAMSETSTQTADRPIVFVHGNGDSAALWHTTLWRFESNGYDRSRLFALDMVAPAAPADDRVDEPNRSTSTEQRDQLAAAVTRILAETGQTHVILVGSSRGGNTIRNYIKTGGGHATVSLAVLCGTPNHGVFASEEVPGSEYNGRGDFLTRLNAGSEIHPDVEFVTIRSDANDKYAQPVLPVDAAGDDLVGGGYDSPALAGALNLVIDGLDHREVAFAPRAFDAIYRAIAGRPPTAGITPETDVRLGGVVSGFANGEPTNLPVSGAVVAVYDVHPETGARLGDPIHRATTGLDGRWGPFAGSPTAPYEFVVSAAGYPTTHVYRSPFPRSTDLIRIRLEPLPGGAASQPAIVTMTRPRGYFGHGRDTFTMDDRVPDGVVAGVPTTSAASMPFAIARTVRVVFNEEALAVRTYPLAEQHVVFAEFHY